MVLQQANDSKIMLDGEAHVVKCLLHHFNKDEAYLPSQLVGPLGDQFLSSTGCKYANNNYHIHVLRHIKDTDSGGGSMKKPAPAFHLASHF